MMVSLILSGNVFPITGASGLEILMFFTDSWEKNWIYSKHPGKEFGKFVRTAGKFYNDEEADKGMLSRMVIDWKLINSFV